MNTQFCGFGLIPNAIITEGVFPHCTVWSLRSAPTCATLSRFEYERFRPAFRGDSYFMASQWYGLVFTEAKRAGETQCASPVRSQRSRSRSVRCPIPVLAA